MSPAGAVRGRRNILSPSILAADFSSLGQAMALTGEGGAEYAHIDVMDGIFVPSIAVGFPVIRCIRKTSDLFFDVHLMIVNPGRYIGEAVEAGADSISFHCEAEEDPASVIRKIRTYGVRAGIVISPGTPVERVYSYLEEADMVLLMGVEPGFGGQAFLPEVMGKIEEARSFIDRHGLSCDVEVDGGVNPHNVRSILDAGANVIVAGSSIYRGDILQNTRNFMRILREQERAVPAASETA